MKLFANIIYPWVVSKIFQWKNVVEDISELQNNASYLFGWMANFEVQYKEHKREYTEELTKMKDKLGLTEYYGVADYLSTLLGDVASLQSALVEAPIDNFYMDTKIDNNMKRLVKNIVALKNVVDDLRTQITKWEKLTEGNPIATKVKDPECLKWFNKHGFSEEILKDITIEELKEHLNKISSIGAPIYRLRELFATYTFYMGPQTTVHKLAWLQVLSGSTAAMSCMRRLMTRVGINESVAFNNAVVYNLASLRNVKGPLAKFFEISRKEKLYAVDAAIYEQFAFKDTHITRYIRILDTICITLVYEIYEFQENASLSNGDMLKTLLEEFGFHVGGVDYSGHDISKRARGLIGENGPITQLCNAVYDYNEDMEASEVKTSFPAADESSASSSSLESTVNPDNDIDGLSGENSQMKDKNGTRGGTVPPKKKLTKSNLEHVVEKPHSSSQTGIPAPDVPSATNGSGTPPEEPTPSETAIPTPGAASTSSEGVTPPADPTPSEAVIPTPDVPSATNGSGTPPEEPTPSETAIPTPGAASTSSEGVTPPADPTPSETVIPTPDVPTATNGSGTPPEGPSPSETGMASHGDASAIGSGATSPWNSNPSETVIPLPYFTKATNGSETPHAGPTPSETGMPSPGAASTSSEGVTPPAGPTPSEAVIPTPDVPTATNVSAASPAEPTPSAKASETTKTVPGKSKPSDTTKQDTAAKTSDTSSSDQKQQGSPSNKAKAREETPTSKARSSTGNAATTGESMKPAGSATNTPPTPKKNPPGSAATDNTNAFKAKPPSGPGASAKGKKSTSKTPENKTKNNEESTEEPKSKGSKKTSRKNTTGSSIRGTTSTSDVQKEAPSEAAPSKKTPSGLSHLSLGAIPIVCVLLFI